MSVFRKVNDSGIIITCDCGCGDTVIIECESSDDDTGYFFMTYANYNWHTEQLGSFDIFKEKLKKIWRIIRNKDHHYSDIRMDREDFKVFKDYINSTHNRSRICRLDVRP